MLRTLKTFAVLGLCAGQLLVLQASVHAQATVQRDEIDSGIKGTLGLGLIGAEMGLVIPALAGVNDAWAYMVFPAVGAAGGALAGYYLLDRNNSSPTASVIVLATGIALVIPAVVTALALTTYEADSEFATPPPPAPGVPTARLAPKHRRSRPSHNDFALVRFAESRAGLGLPLPSIAPLSPLPKSPWERLQGVECRVALLSATF